jgi:hypothetical protein
MSGRGKRLWPSNLDLDSAYKETLEFLKRCSAHKINVSLPHPTIYKSYKIDGYWGIGELTPISVLLKFGYSNDPLVDRAKISIARLLCVALKTHYFLSNNAIVPSEPVWFSIPDLANPGNFRYGLIYNIIEPADKNGPAKQKTIITAEWDLTLSSSIPPHIQKNDEFPVILQPDPFTWIRRKSWIELKEKSGNNIWFENLNNQEKITWLNNVHNHKTLNDFKFGNVLDCPIELKDDASAAGAIWARGIKHWFMPHGFDFESVQIWLNYLKSLTNEERINQRWWVKRK